MHVLVTRAVEDNKESKFEVLMSANRNRRMKMVATSDVEKDTFFAVLRSYGIEEVLMTSFRS